jgi:hypothetical protein
MFPYRAGVPRALDAPAPTMGLRVRRAPLGAALVTP